MGGKDEDLWHSHGEMIRKKQEDFNMNEWSFEYRMNIPHLENGPNCAVFECSFAEHIARDARIDFTQQLSSY